MISLVIASAVYLAVAQSASADATRKAFTACLRGAVDKAKAEKVALAGFDAYARAQCAPVSTKFVDVLVSFDVKNKVPRKQATSDAQSQITDYYTETGERYKYQIEAGGGKSQ
jgi:hypothetical protein